MYTSREALGVRWEELQRNDHVLQIYDEDGLFLDGLQGYVMAGLESGESVVVIATPSHCNALRERLAGDGVDVAAAERDDRFIALDAQDTLDLFMVGNMPDEARFRTAIGAVLARARSGGRDLRAFGEMVALLWARGNQAGAVALEMLWNNLLGTERFPLFCAYPRMGFGREFSSAVHRVCASHTRVFGT
jgi:hypothetical protein